ncbi:hypothetical protein [Pseudoroseomonas cervicalis]|uniref:hypothetical protein n=1 Tax=Teichococcus cervicalis TaxID=204525 RepID=UPI002786BCDD|nr:hypothetical protein [Pseudoroseomonas cervicalis]MDQ1079008.1 Cdc6-like AAA superfamily ATPase [Pseudoroseomonas cervicalis]
MDMNEALRLVAANMAAQSHRLLGMAQQLNRSAALAEEEEALPGWGAAAEEAEPAPASQESLASLRTSHQLLGEAIALLEGDG